MNTIFIRYPMKMNEVMATMVARETGTGVFGVSRMWSSRKGYLLTNATLSSFLFPHNVVLCCFHLFYRV
jgi:hypothetical protein